jgi:transposase-like protein
MLFQPRHCPRPDCPSHTTHHFRWRRKGRFIRRCDGRSVPRFTCLECHRTFSSQTFRVDYRLKKPRLHLELFKDFVSKTTMRQSSRMLGCKRRTVAHRLALLGDHCRTFHEARLERARNSGGIEGSFLLDELETFEHSRRLKPVTVPVLVERKSYFIVHAACAPLAARGGLSPLWRKKKEALEALGGKRSSGSVAVVRECFEALASVHRARRPVVMATDRKPSYASNLKRIFGARLRHKRHSSKAARNYENALFPINLTFAMLRDGLSRLVRRSWAASKLRAKLALHLWIWIAYRNYVRAITNDAPDVTPATAIGIERRMWRREEILAWRVFRFAGL